MMLRRILAATAICGLFGAIALADDFKAVIKKIDADKNTIVVTVDGAEKTYTVAKDAEIYSQAKGKKNKPGAKEPIAGGLTGLKTDAEVTITTIKSGDKDVVGAIKVEGGMKKKKKTDK